MSPKGMSEPSGLDRLIAPVTSEVLAEHWEASPLLVKRQRPAFFDSLLTLATVDEVITTFQLSHPDIALADASREIKTPDYTHEGGAIDPLRLYQQYERGATIILNRLDRFVGPLSELCRSLERELCTRFQANVYLTPGENQGLRAHYDSHDVFVAQVVGTKHWVIYDTPKELPFRGESFGDSPVEPGPVTMEFDLEPGDTFYLPRGIMHRAVAQGGTSLHLTVGVLPISWADLVLEAVARMSLNDTELRKSLPVGFARDDFDRAGAESQFRKLMRRVADQADFHGALDHFADDLITTRTLLLRDQISQIHRLPKLTVDSIVSGRQHLMYRVRATDEDVTIVCHVGEIQFPAHAAPAVRHALASVHYRVSELPGDLDDEGKLVLVRRLVREGLVQID